MDFFSKIVKSRPNWRIGIDPLWKLQITDQEYEDLKNHLTARFMSYRLRYAERESTLFFAEWWKREYCGGHHRKLDVAKCLGLEIFSEALFQDAIKGAKMLRIRFIQIETTRYLDTLLLQGGLPLKALAQGDRVNRYEVYLSRIVRYVSSHMISWESVDFIKRFNDYISPSFQNEVMYELALRIVQAIYYEDDSYYPFDIDNTKFDELVQLLKKIKKEVNNVSRENPFSNNWSIVKKGNRISLNYEIECEKIISQEWLNQKIGNTEDPYTRLNIAIEDEISQKYIRKNNGDYSVKFSGQKICGDIKSHESAAISCQIITNTNKVVHISIPNGDLPNFDFPILATEIYSTEQKSHWKTLNSPIKGNTNVVVCPEEWL
jgi:hypothetical protein